MKEWIIPQERRFFDLLEGVASTVNDGAVALLDMVRHFQNIPAKRRAIKDIEHRGDDLTHDVFEALNRTFITPIDREDIQSHMKQGDEVERIAVEVHHLENVADDLMNNSIAALFKDPDPIRIIKLKEITERLEQATDYCEDVANVLSDIVAKNQ